MTIVPPLAKQPQALLRGGGQQIGNIAGRPDMRACKAQRLLSSCWSWGEACFCHRVRLQHLDEGRSRSLIVGNEKLIVPQRRSDRSITGHRIAHHQHLPKQFSECAAMSIRTPHLDAITLPCTFTVPDKS